MKRMTISNPWTAVGAALVLSSALACGQGKAPSQAPDDRIFLATGAGESCNPAGAHPKHAYVACTTCHVCQGSVQFDPAGAAVAAGQPPPSFDPTTQRCSNVACHGVPAGSFTYWFTDGSGEATQIVVGYGGTARPTPAWTTTGAGCTACHDNPPRNGSTGSNVWHSGRHAGQGPTGAANQCQFCHPDATGSGGIGTAVTNPALHANGVVDVQARFKSSCFGCH
jgi:hypothetical protein